MPTDYSRGGSTGSSTDYSRDLPTKRRRSRLPGTKAQRDFIKKHKNKGWAEKIGTVLEHGAGEVAAFGPGLYGTVRAPVLDAWNFDIRHPLRSPKHTLKLLGQMKDSYVYKYGPAFGGDFGETLHRMGESPIGTILDIATIPTAGTAAAVKTGLLRPAARSVVLRGEGKIAGQMASKEGATRAGLHEIEIPITGSEFSRRMKIKRHQHLNKLPEDMRGPLRNARYAIREARGLTEPLRYSKAIARANAREVRRFQLVAHDYQLYWNKLSEAEQIAHAFRVQYRTLPELERYKAQLDAEAPLRQVINNSELRELFKRPSRNMVKAEEAMKKLTDYGTDLVNLDDPLRPYIPILIARGYRHFAPAHSEKVDFLRARIDSLELKEARNMKERAKDVFSQQQRIQMRPYGTPTDLPFTGGMFPNRNIRGLEREVVLPTGATLRPQHSTRVAATRSELSAAKDDLERYEKNLATRRGITVEEVREQFEPGWYKADPDGKPIRDANGQRIPAMVEVEKIMAEHAAAGIEPPIYYPHHSVPDPKIGFGGGGKTPKPKHYTVKKNKGLLALAGKAAVDIDVVTPEFMRKVAWAAYSDRHADLVAAGRVVERGHELARGEMFVRQTPGDKVSYMEGTAGEYQQRASAFAERFGDRVEVSTAEEAGLTGMAKDLVTDIKDDALAFDEAGHVDPEGLYRVVVSEKVADNIVGEYTRSSDAVRRFYNNPTMVWRALVLNLRVGWLINNIVGNTLMFLFANAGDEGLNALRRMDPRENISKEWVRTFAPEQGTTFIGSQTPMLRAQSRIGRAAQTMIQGQWAPTKLLRQADVATEQALRRRMLSNRLRRNPEFRKFYKEMEGQTNRFDAAATKLAEMDPMAINRISKEMNDAMGNFFDLSHTERTALRGIFPFYAWYKAIVGVSLRMVVDHPLRAQVYMNIARIGQEIQEDDYGLHYLTGRIPLPGGLSLKTQAMNPYNTVPGLGRATIGAGTLIGFPTSWSNRMAAQGLMNPILGLPSGLQDDNPYRGTGLYGIGRGLPEMRIPFPFGSDLYEGSDRWREVGSYFGAPIVRVNEEEARRRGNQ